MVKTNHNILGKNEITFREGQVAFVSEPGLYALIMNSSTKFATMFQELVLETILPSIRRYGSYQAEMRLTETMAQLAIRDQSYEEECDKKMVKENHRKIVRKYFFLWLKKPVNVKFFRFYKNVFLRIKRI